MAILLWIIVGGIAGWLASLFTGTEARRGVMLNIVAGIAGASLGGLIYAGDGDNRTLLDLMSFIASLFGAVILLCGVHLLARGLR